MVCRDARIDGNTKRGVGLAGHWLGSSSAATTIAICWYGLGVSLYTSIFGRFPRVVCEGFSVWPAVGLNALLRSWRLKPAAPPRLGRLCHREGLQTQTLSRRC